MTNERPRITLTTILGAGLLAYHGYNLFHLSELRPSYKWNPSRLALSLGGRDRLSVPLVTGVRNGNAVTDASARRLGELGGMVRYFAGQAQIYLHVGRRNPVQWVYLREEAFVQYDRGEAWVTRSYTEPLRPWVARLEEKGITAIVLAVPTKMSIERAGAGPGPLSWNWREIPPTTEDPYSNYRAFIESLPRNAVDLYRGFFDYRRGDSESFFYRPMGTHWTTLGAAVAAASVVDKLRERGWDLPPPRIERLAEPEPDDDDSFYSQLLIPSYLSRSLSRWWWAQSLHRLAAPQADPANGRLVLVGTSYAYANPEGYRYGEQLARALRRRLVMYAAPGDGLHAGTLERMKKEGFVLHPSDLVVLEFCFRFPWPPGARLQDLEVTSDRHLSSH